MVYTWRLNAPNRKIAAGVASKRRESPAPLAQFLAVANHTGIAHNVRTMPATDIVYIGRCE